MKKSSKRINISLMAIFAVLFFCIFVMGCSDNTGSLGAAHGKILILQAYGNAGDGSPAGASHSFVELYNVTDEDIDLSGISLYYANGIRGTDVTADEPWKSIALTGTIPAKGSYLILGKKHNDLTDTRYKIEDNYGDINDDNLSLSRRSFKVALIEGTEELSVQNPYNINGYIDMVGAANNLTAADPDNIFGYEEAPARCSASEGVRRRDLDDYDDNSTDFIAARYASGGFSNQVLEERKPRNSKEGSWSPFPEDAATDVGPSSNYAGKLLIFQAGAATDGAITRSFVELYNNTDLSINLNTYSIQYANAVGTTWTVINLTGTIPAKSSYLIRGPLGATYTNPRLYIEAADQTIDDFTLSNNNFKVALMANQKKLTVENPFDMTGGKAAGYVDMVGAKNSNSDSIDGYEAALAQIISKQAAARRGSLEDTDDNSADFVRIDYRDPAVNANGVDAAGLVKFRPRYSVDGTWTPEF